MYDMSQQRVLMAKIMLKEQGRAALHPSGTRFSKPRFSRM
jgi:hypothetical protein